ncbi:MAG: sulfotransferase [Chitinophagaceae bacterium]|nr:sulfotransferase [Chitinophagaceae bacterium]
MNEAIASALKNWLPYRLLPQADDELFCKWFYLGDEMIKEPFFNDTILRCRSLPYNSTLKSSISSVSLLQDWSEQLKTALPAAFIFHVSRCGSTLLSQLLSVQKENIVLSEVPFFDELLRKGFAANTMNEILPAVKASVAMYSAQRNEYQQHVFIKTDSWHIHFYKELRLLYPDVPFVFLYRKPDEVIRSHQKKRGMQAVPGVIEPALFGFDLNEILSINLDEYMARVLETYLQKFLEILETDSNCIAINYNEGAMTMMHRIAAFINIPINAEDEAAMLERAGFHAKYPGEKFYEPAVEDEPPLYLQKAFELYHQLEQVKNFQQTN